MENNWQNNDDFLTTVSHFVEKLQVWNKDVFGNIFYKKKWLLAHIVGIQKALESYNFPNLERLEVQL